MKLNIIANGFDLHHGLRTKLSDYALYLKEKDKDFYEMMLRYFPLDKNWNNLEDSLLNFKIHSALSDLDDNLPELDNERSGLEWIYYDQASNLVHELPIKIQNTINDWIVSLDYSGLKRISNISFDNCKILSFNYTNTIEQIYKTDQRVLHIHNIARKREVYLYKPDEMNLGFPNEEDSEIILGHSPVISLNQYIKNPEFDCYQNTLRQINYESLLQIIERTTKDTFYIIKQHETFFNELSNCDEVIVYGHSFGTCDIPYFIKIVSSVSKNASFTFYYHTTEDMRKIKTFTSKYLRNNKCDYIPW